MPSSLLPEADDPPAGSVGRERMWPLDAALLALGGLVMYLAVDRLDFEDPRWQYNAGTYVLLIPTGVAGIAFVLHRVTGRFLQRSVQLGFLVSVFVHLLLLILAVNVVIFSRYFPDSFTGFQAERSPVRKTVPDHLFQKQSETSEQADWAQPVDAETASREIPEEMRQLPPQEKSAPRLELPTDQPQRESELEKFLIPRQEVAESMPSPRSEPAPLARRQSRQTPPVPTAVEAPDVPPVETASPRSPERRPREMTRAAVAAGAKMDLPLPELPRQPSAPEREVQFRPLDQNPQVGEIVRAAPRRATAARSEPATPAGAAPQVPRFSIARQDPDASHQLRREPAPLSRRSRQQAASLADLGVAGPAPRPAELPPQVASNLRGPPVPQAGVPQVDAGEVAEVRGRASRDRAKTPPLPVGPPSLAGVPQPAAGETAGSSAADAPTMSNREGLARRRLDESGVPGPPAPSLQPPLRAEEGPLGFAMQPVARGSFSGIPDLPDPTTVGLGRRPQPRKAIGGPLVPAGIEVASVESFQRRVMRTSGGAAPTPQGEVAPQTEEAIERGLAYLAERQQDDGSWSLGGEGERVVMQSDTAATGLALLAFQGAGYTHRQHQYASVVAKGLGFLLQNQRDDGDLFRREDAASNQNVWLYSHAIAALALCEAYGMTQDPELERPAQQAIAFIIASQHPSRGGWRYRPRNSSDTSVSGWMMMALKSGELSGLQVPAETYEGIDQWLRVAQAGPGEADRYRYNPYAPNNESQRHGREVTRTMTAVAMLMRMYGGWRRDNPMMQSGADFLAEAPPAIGRRRRPLRDTYYWYYATQVMFHMGGEYWQDWNRVLTPLLVDSQRTEGPRAGSWDPRLPVPDRWSVHGGRLYVTAMNLLSLEVYYRHLPIYEETAR